MSITSFILPLVIVLITVTGLLKKTDVFDCFAKGAEQGLQTAISLLPVLCGLMVAVSMLKASGGIKMISELLSPAFSLFGIPEEVIPLCILSPVSGSGSLSVYESILAEAGPDSVAGRIASVISGSTETTFYAVAVYLGSVGIKKSGVTVPCALIGDFVSYAVAAFTVNMFF